MRTPRNPASISDLSNGLALNVPDEVTAARFDELVEPLLAGIINEAKRIQNLRQTRDLLLPRLLSGQVPIHVPDNETSVDTERESLRVWV